MQSYKCFIVRNVFIDIKYLIFGITSLNGLGMNIWEPASDMHFSVAAILDAVMHFSKHSMTRAGNHAGPESV